MPQPTAKLSLVIATLNREDRLRETIDSLRRQTFQDWELFVVDQSAHGEATCQWLNQLADHRIIYRTWQPPSLTQSRNLGISLASSPIIIFIDDDVLLHDGFLEAYVEAFQDPEIHAVAGRVVQKGFAVSAHPMTLKLGGVQSGTFDCPTDQDATAVQGCNMAFRKGALLAVGGFDSRFTKNAYREESDLCFRLKKKGSRIVYRKDAALTHIPERSGGCRPSGTPKLNQIVKFRNETLFFLKHWALWRLPQFFWNQLFIVVWKRKLPKRPHEFAQVFYFKIGFWIGLWVYLTGKPRELVQK